MVRSWPAPTLLNVVVHQMTPPVGLWAAVSYQLHPMQHYLSLSWKPVFSDLW